MGYYHKITVLILLAVYFPINIFGIDEAPRQTDLVWEINPLFGPDDQGFRIFYSSEKSVDSENGLLCLSFAAGGKKNLLLQTNFGTGKSKLIHSKEIKSLVFRMKANVKNSSPDEKPVLKFSWNFLKSKEYSLQTSIINDNKFHEYRIFVNTHKDWTESNKGWITFKLFPYFVSGKATGTVEIDYIRFELTDDAELQRLINQGNMRIIALEDFSKTLYRNGIKIKGIETDIKKLRNNFEEIKAAKKVSVEKRLKGFETVEKQYVEINRKITCGRRLNTMAESAKNIYRAVRFSAAKSINVENNKLTKVAAFCSRLKELSQDIQKIEQDIDGFEKRLDAEEDTLTALWNSLLNKESDTQLWQPGLSFTSFGRFGWVYKARGLLTGELNRNSFERVYFKNANNSKTILKFEPVGAAYTHKQQMNEITWVSQDRDFGYQNSKKERVRWNLKASVLAPGFLLSTDARGVTFYVECGKSFAPTALLAPVSGGVRLIRDKSKIKNLRLSENWLLLLCDNGFPSVPWLLNFEKRPDSFTWGKESFVVNRRRGVGTIGVSNPYGVFPLPIDYSANMKTPTEDMVNKCRETAAIMNCYPYRCDEYFRLDRSSGTVKMANTVQHLEIANDWKTPGKKIAPVPPVLSFACQNAYPIKLPESIKDFGIPTIYGPLMAAEGNMVEYDLKIPDLRNPTFLKTDILSENQKEAERLCLTMSNRKVENKPVYSLSIMNTFYTCWNFFSPEAQEFIKKCSLSVFNKYKSKYGLLKSLDGPYHSHLCIERVEPFSGLDYLVSLGWHSDRFGKRVMGDITNYSGFNLYSLYLYAKYTGDWNLVYDNWKMIKRIFSVNLCRCDWPTMAQDCMEYGITHTTDMGPDSWAATCYMSKLADAAGDRRSADMAMYMAAKQVIPLTNVFSKRKWDISFCNTWDHEKNMPERGYGENGLVSMSDKWQTVYSNFNFIVGCVIAQEVVYLYRDFCKDAATNFEYKDLLRYIPLWNDWTKLAQAHKGKEFVGAFSRNLLLRDALGESSETLLPAFEKAVKVSPLSASWGIDALKAKVLSVMVGRDAPCRLADWIPARLDRAVYESKTQLVTVTFQSDKPFFLNVISFAKPSSIKIDDEVLPENQWSFNQENSSLCIPVYKTGRVKLELSYPNWAMQREAIVLPQTDEQPTEPMLICMQEKTRSENYLDITTDNFQLRNPMPLDLKPFINMELIQTPNSDEQKPYSVFGLKSLDRNPVSGFGRMPRGKQKFRGVPFNIIDPAANDGKAIIGLYGNRATKLPKKITGIKVGKRLKYVYFLHASQWSKGGDVPALKYTLHYKNGKSVVVTALSGKDIGNFWYPKELPKAKLAFSVDDEKGHKIGAFIGSWENTAYDEIQGVNNTEQRDVCVIDTIDIESTGEEGAVAVLAITGDLSE